MLFLPGLDIGLTYLATVLRRSIGRIYLGRGRADSGLLFGAGPKLELFLFM